VLPQPLWPQAKLFQWKELPLLGIRIHHDDCDLKSSGNPGVMLRSTLEKEGYLQPTTVVVPPSGLQDPPWTLKYFQSPDSRTQQGRLLVIPGCLAEHWGPKYTQPPNRAHWLDPSHGPPKGLGPPREGEVPDHREAFSEEGSVMDQELSRENDAGYREDGNPSFLSIPSARKLLESGKSLTLREEMDLLASFAPLYLSGLEGR
jgi:hypothetical protein